MNLGSILALGCLSVNLFLQIYQHLGGGRQPKSIGLSAWTVHVEKSRHFGWLSCPRARRALLAEDLRILVYVSVCFIRRLSHTHTANTLPIFNSV